jgi:hypothetical protein
MYTNHTADSEYLTLLTKVANTFWCLFILDSLDSTLEQFNVIEEKEKTEKHYQHKANLLR